MYVFNNNHSSLITLSLKQIKMQEMKNMVEMPSGAINIQF